MRSVFALLAVAGFCGLAALASSAVANVVGQAQSASLMDTGSLAGAARIRAGEINCPHCDLHGADLSHQCVEHGDLTGANFDHAVARSMCMAFADFSSASFRKADLTGADLRESNLANSDLTGATLVLANLSGADFSTAKGLTQTQIDRACGDAATLLPAGLHVKFCM
jgi:uncharacterized protein YjbI with pentapeptide repeats